MWRPEVWSLRQFKQQLTGQSPYLLRLGQAFMQLWRFNGHGWVQIGCLPVHHLGHDQYQAIADLLPGLTQALPLGASVQVLADSKWMPVSLLNTGKAPLSRNQVDVLAKHRFAQIFGESANHWTIQTSYVAGDAQAMAFGCPAGLQACLRQSLEAQQPNGRGKYCFTGLAPTLSWAWNEAWRAHVGQAGSWLVLAEHDRSILVWASKGQASALQPAGPILLNPAQVNQLLKTESLRCGVVEETCAVLGTSFEDLPSMKPPHMPEGFQWRVFEVVESAT
ncbi:hypothetical protein [Aquabacterium sp.]|uniref:hypothetical protein n=1 Tax=Aquabacterium sp. TaxID=1872578 RepID=UPI0019CD6914|nr:hypothetical protein [Aquabacterium sp.]MBC7701778.1 hypothetical protein [Aquabacterium sp.]